MLNTGSHTQHILHNSISMKLKKSKSIQINVHDDIQSGVAWGGRL